MSKQRILSRTMLITLMTIFIKSSNARTGREACEDKDFDNLSCLNVGCCFYNNTISACLSDVGDHLCHEEQSWLWATIAITFGLSMLCCFVYVIRIRNPSTKHRTWKENYADLTFSRNCTEMIPSSVDFARRMEISDLMWRRDKLISVRENITHRPPRTKNELAIAEESDIESIPEDMNKKNHQYKNWNWNFRSERQTCRENTFDERKDEEMSEYAEDICLNDIRNRNSILTKAGSALKDLNSQSLSAHDVGLSSKFGDEANVLPWDEIQILEQCGMGTYGKIYTATYDYMKVAVKVLNVPWEKLPWKQRQEFLLEIQTAIQVSHHENVLRVYGCTLEPVVSIITELCDHGSVLDCIKNGYKLTIDKKLDICIDAARGVLSLHDKNVLHRDIASRNVLLDRHMTARIADFGMCRILKPVRTGQEAAYHTFSKVGPLKWMSPESLLMQKTSKKSDVWSFGITIWEIFTEEEPYGTEPPYLAAAGVIHRGLHPDLSKLPSPINKNLIPLLRACWRVCPEDRSSMQNVLTELIKVQQNRLSLQPAIISLATPKTPSSSVRSLPNIIYTIPVANSSEDYYDQPHLNFCSSQRSRSLSRKIKPYPSQSSSSNIFHPKKTLQISPSQYSGITSIGPSCDYPQYSSPEQSYKRIQKIMITAQTRQNTEELGYRSSLPFAIPRSTSFSLSSPKIGKQYSNMIPSNKIRATQSFQELSTITPTPCNTPRLSPIPSMPKIPVGMRVVYYRNIDSISTTEPTTPENKIERGTAASISDLKSGTVMSPLLASDVRVNEHYKNFDAHRYRGGKAVSARAFKSPKRLLWQQMTTLGASSLISHLSCTSTPGSDAENVLVGVCKCGDVTMV